jgi:benzoyl-CoA reductase subunit B
VEGPPNWTHFREFWKMFHDEGAVVVASTYTKVGGLYDRGFRHDPDRPLESLAEYCLGCYTNLGLPRRVELISEYVRDYQADGFVINSVKSCDSFSSGQLVMLREIEGRLARGEGPITPEGSVDEERFRMVVEGPPNWTHFREFWKMFYDEGAVVVASTYTRVGGLYDRGFRHDPDHPLESLADYCLGCYTNLDLPTRVDLIAGYVRDYGADGFLINSIKSCNSFSAGQLVMLREIEKRTGRPGAFIETDLVDPRYFAASNVKTRLESFFQMLAQKRSAPSEPALAGGSS